MEKNFRNLISITDLSIEEIDHLIDVANDIVENHDDYTEICKVKSWRLCSLNHLQEQD